MSTQPLIVDSAVVDLVEQTVVINAKIRALAQSHLTLLALMADEYEGSPDISLTVTAKETTPGVNNGDIDLLIEIEAAAS